uniref:Uncharacterized protein n=1 Tax=Nomascus leucogenys TaxID=61853 RepID=A0A2I3H3L9_NOMLE
MTGLWTADYICVYVYMCDVCTYTHTPKRIKSKVPAYFKSLEALIEMLHVFSLLLFTVSSQSSGNSAWHIVGVW